MKYSLSKNTKSKITLWSYYIKQYIYKALQNSNTREADSTKKKNNIEKMLNNMKLLN